MDRKEDNLNYFKYWGKASRENNSYHLLPYHCLDVAAVGHLLIQNNIFHLSYFQRLTGLNRDQLITWFTFLLVLHDLGKFADSFQNLKPSIPALLQKRNSSQQTGLIKHK